MLKQLFLDEIRRCSSCPLGSLEPNIRRGKVAGAGYVPAPEMVIGLAPSWFGDFFEGTPFSIFNEELCSGRDMGPGASTRRMLQRILNDLKVERFYITNLLKCAFKEDREWVEESKACLEFLKREIRQVQPFRLILLGSIVSKLFGIESLPEMKEKGRFTIVAIHHPAYFVRCGVKSWEEYFKRHERSLKW